MTTHRYPRRLPTRDTLAAAGGAALFSCALGLASVALPLLAIEAGYDAVQIGVLTAVSAIAQMVSRLGLGVVMRVLPDWTLVAGATVVLAASNAMVAVSAAVVPFVVAQLLQGVARACFWTGSQTHAVRREGSSVKSLAAVNFVSNVGLLLGPLLAGVLAARSPAYALGWGAAMSALALVPTVFMDRLRPFRRVKDAGGGQLWRRPGVAAGCWAGVTAGAWRGLVGSYVPVVLTHAGHTSTVVGALVAVANATSVGGSAIAGRTSRAALSRAFAVCTVVTGVSLGVVGFLAGNAWLAGVALGVSGLASGTLQTLGPAIASDSVHPEERGEAIAVAGTFRAAALFVAPFGVAGLVLAIPLSAAIGVAGLLVTAPALTVTRLRGALSASDHERQAIRE
ncbi:MFS transporter [Nocardioides sp. NPDC047086]|uniref:MFS transporter n=1 Tax=Nocardioides sp. NPDC047086 TaxID=3154810 RepID=UPI0033E9DFF9